MQFYARAGIASILKRMEAKAIVVKDRPTKEMDTLLDLVLVLGTNCSAAVSCSLGPSRSHVDQLSVPLAESYMYGCLRVVHHCVGVEATVPNSISLYYFVFLDTSSHVQYYVHVDIFDID